MSASTVLAVGIVVAVLVALAALAALLLAVLRRSIVRGGKALAEELAEDPPVHGPELAEYAGGTRDVLRSRSRGVLVLTGTRLLFREPRGRGLDIPLAGLQARVDATFDGERRRSAGTQDDEPTHLVLVTPSGTAGFIVDEPDVWRRVVDETANPIG